MHRKIIVLINFVLFCAYIRASESDTILNMVISKPYFYNVVQNNKGEIFLGTAEGVFKINGEKMSYFGSSPGYIKIGNAGNPEIDSLGISSYQNRKYLYLLPYPDAKREEYHTGNDRNFYIVSGGRLHIFDIEPYTISFKNQSIRSISRNLVGGYSGVFYKGKKLDFPNYTDGYIREFGDTAFICYGGLMIITPEKIENFLYEPSYSAYLDSVVIGKIDDLFYDANTHLYVMSTSSGIYLVGSDMKSPRKIFTNKPGDPIVLLGSKYDVFSFSAGNKVMAYSFKNHQLDFNDSTSENIISGIMPDKRYIYTLSSNTLYKSTTNGYFNKLATLNEAHTLLALNEKELVISSNKGLYLFNLETNTLQTIIHGVEFNRRALYLENNKLYAGSVNGLYTIDVNQIKMMTRRNENILKGNSSITSFLYLGVFALFIFFILIIALIRSRRKLKNAEREIITVRKNMIAVKERRLNKEMIEQYIRENLSTASLKSINEYFSSNTSQIYTLLDPDKPGTIIQKLRLELVIEMRRMGADIKDISESTGLSESYIKKIRTIE